MTNDTAEHFAGCSRGLVVAPAGCGKTHLIGEAVGLSQGRQLVLTHTHAGVGAIRARLAAEGIPPKRFLVTTIDSLALCYVSAFPDLADWKQEYPDTDGEWNALRAAASRLFSCRAPRRVLEATYNGLFVDEYQDCCNAQHGMIETIAEVLPCRVVGDPLQAIYRKLHPNDTPSWGTVERTFSRIGEMDVPYRWLKTNPELGEWLAEVRSQLIQGGQIDFSNSNGAAKWIPSAEEMVKVAECYKALSKKRVIVICDWTSRCAALAAKMKNHFTVLESVECHDLLQAAADIEGSTGIDRVARVVKFAQQCFTGMNPLSDLVDRIKKAKSYSARSPDKKSLWRAMKGVIDSANLREVGILMLAIDALSIQHSFKRRELWQEMQRCVNSFDHESDTTLSEAAWIRRDYARRNGRRIRSRRTIATPLLIKGLEFDHALLTDAAQMKSAEELYVALTRGSTSLTILSHNARVGRAIPAWIRESQGQT